jgi:hypothetical protein
MMATEELKLGALASAASTTARSKEMMGSSCLSGSFSFSPLSFLFFRYSHSVVAILDQEVDGIEGAEAKER